MAIHYIKKGDRLPVLEDTVNQDLTGATLQVRWQAEGGGTVETRSATIVSVDTANGTSEVEYQWAASDTDTPGRYKYEWIATISGKLLTVPGLGHQRFVVTPILE